MVERILDIENPTELYLVIGIFHARKISFCIFILHTMKTKEFNLWYAEQFWTVLQYMLQYMFRIR